MMRTDYFGDLLMSQGKLDEAFQRFRLVDSLGNGEGKRHSLFCRPWLATMAITGSSKRPATT